MKTLQTTALQRADRRAKLQEIRDIAAHKLHMAEIRLDPALAARRAKAALAKRAKDLKDPNAGRVRFYPAYVEGMRVSQYIRTYQALNTKVGNSPQLDFVDLHGRGLW